MRPEVPPGSWRPTPRRMPLSCPSRGCRVRAVYRPQRITTYTFSYAGRRHVLMPTWEANARRSSMEGWMRVNAFHNAQHRSRGAARGSRALQGLRPRLAAHWGGAGLQPLHRRVGGVPRRLPGERVDAHARAVRAAPHAGLHQRPHRGAGGGCCALRPRSGSRSPSWTLPASPCPTWAGRWSSPTAASCTAPRARTASSAPATHPRAARGSRTGRTGCRRSSSSHPQVFIPCARGRTSSASRGPTTTRTGTWCGTTRRTRQRETRTRAPWCCCPARGCSSRRQNRRPARTRWGSGMKS
jgi:hypothetical protein